MIPSIYYLDSPGGILPLFQVLYLTQKLACVNQYSYNLKARRPYTVYNQGNAHSPHGTFNLFTSSRIDDAN